MKTGKIIAAIMAAVTLFTLNACRADDGENTAGTAQTVGSAEESTYEMPETLAQLEGADEIKSVVIYFSLGEGIEKTAEYIAEKTNADVFEIRTSVDYAGGRAVLEKEIADGVLPVINGRVENLTDYGAVFLGFPSVNGQLPAEVVSFIREYDLRDTVLLPFCTENGEDLGGVTAAIDRFSFGSSQAVLLSLGNAENAEKKADEWLTGLGF